MGVYVCGCACVGVYVSEYVCGCVCGWMGVCGCVFVWVWVCMSMGVLGGGLAGWAGIRTQRLLITNPSLYR